MRFKIDENLHPEVAELLRQHRHDATTVYDQGLRGHSDAVRRISPSTLPVPEAVISNTSPLQ
jgi:Domain of unknown function (DUF5615)